MSRLKIGDIAPNFSFAGQHRTITELENLKGKIVVIFFVRSPFWRPCRTRTSEFGRTLSQFRAENAEILIVVPAKREKTAKYASALGFDGFVVPDNEKNIYRRYGLDTSFMGAMQKSEVFIVDENSEVVFAQGHGSPLRLPEVTEVLDVVKTLNMEHSTKNDEHMRNRWTIPGIVFNSALFW